MSVRIKVFLSLAFTVLLLWLVTSFFATKIFTAEFNTVDEQNLRRQITRVIDALRDTETQARATSTIFSLAEGDPLNEIDPIAVRGFLETLRLDFLAVFSAEGELQQLYVPGALEGQLSTLPLQDEAALAVQAMRSIRRNTPVSGVVTTTFGPAYFASEAIELGGKGGPVQGAIVAGTFLNQQLEDRLREKLLLALRFAPPPPSVRKLPAPPEDPIGEVVLDPIRAESDHLTGYAPIYSTSGDPVLAIVVERARQVYAAGNRSLRFLLGITGAFGIVLVLLVTAAVEFLFVGRLRRLTASARRADQFGMQDLPAGFLKGRDEISHLAQVTRGMFDRLRASQALYRTVVETQSELILRYGEDGTITFANEAFARFFNLHPKAVIGRKVGELPAPNAASFSHELIHPLPDRQGTRSRTLVVGDVTGQERHIEWNERLIKEADGTVREIQAVGRDISLHIEYEAKLREAREAAEASDRAKAEFLAIVGHETRTPLSSVLGFANLLESTDLDTQQKEYVQLILESADSLLYQLNDVVDYTRLHGGEVTLHPYTFEVRPFVERIAAMHRGVARSKNLSFEVDLSEAAPKQIVGDPNRIEQILHNLLENALRLTEQGFVRLSVCKAPEDRIRFSVLDSGPGIPERKLASLLAPGDPMSLVGKKSELGSGLGLPISQRLVALMGGSISVKSTLEIGSEFWFELPIGNAVAPPIDWAPAAEEKKVESVEGLGLEVLIVEDNLVNQKVARLMLDLLGADSDACEGGVTALKRIRQRHYDLILLDIQLPDLDGFELTQKIREQERAEGRAPAYIVACTAFTIPGDRERCLEAGMNDYIAKPLKRGTLSAVLARFLDRRAVGSAPSAGS